MGRNSKTIKSTIEVNPADLSNLTFKKKPIKNVIPGLNFHERNSSMDAYHDQQSAAKLPRH